MSRRGGPVGVFNGNWRRKLREEMDELASDRKCFISENNKLNFGEALDTLKAADPAWETWFDDDANIPPYIHWTDSAEIESLCRRMTERAIQCQNAVPSQ
jgi:hypothetical protein